MQYGVIMAGGAGTRLWPLSRSDRPKQLLPVVRGKSLLQLSYERLRGLLPPDRIFVCTGAPHGQAVLDNLPELPKENLLGEPTGRDTANAVGFPAAVLRQRDKDAVTAVVTADHVIAPLEKFQAAIKTAFDVVAAEPNSLVTFGIVPAYGHTGLGYIHRGESLATSGGRIGGAYRVLSFKEKPDKSTADRYAESGRYYWNSGMFVWRCDTVLDELQQHLPQSYRGLTQIAQTWDDPAKRDAVLREVYPELPKISIDYAVMEHAREVLVVQAPFRWDDVGSWLALERMHPQDVDGNTILATHCGLHTRDCIIAADPGHLVATVGVDNLLIVQDGDATLVADRRDEGAVKQLVDLLKKKGLEKYL